MTQVIYEASFSGKGLQTGVQRASLPPMHDPFFFGYGSPVNRATHDFPQATQARVRGWRRAWRHMVLREVAYLSAVPDPDAEIDGQLAAVPGHDWAALDHRNRADDRHKVCHAIEHEKERGFVDRELSIRDANVIERV